MGRKWIGEIEGLVYFKNTGDLLVAQVHSDDFNWGGNSGSRIELQRIENGKIYLQSFEYAHDDGRCCPSIPNTTIVRVDDNDFWLRSLKNPINQKDDRVSIFKRDFYPLKSTANMLNPSIGFTINAGIFASFVMIYSS